MTFVKLSLSIEHKLVNLLYFLMVRPVRNRDEQCGSCVILPFEMNFISNVSCLVVSSITVFGSFLPFFSPVNILHVTDLFCLLKRLSCSELVFDFYRVRGPFEFDYYFGGGEINWENSCCLEASWQTSDKKDGHQCTRLSWKTAGNNGSDSCSNAHK